MRNFPIIYALDRNFVRPHPYCLPHWTMRDQVDPHK